MFHDKFIMSLEVCFKAADRSCNMIWILRVYNLIHVKISAFKTPVNVPKIMTHVSMYMSHLYSFIALFGCIKASKIGYNFGCCRLGFFKHPFVIEFMSKFKAKVFT